MEPTVAIREGILHCVKQNEVLTWYNPRNHETMLRPRQKVNSTEKRTSQHSKQSKRDADSGIASSETSKALSQEQTTTEETRTKECAENKQTLRRRQEHEGSVDMEKGRESSSVEAKDVHHTGSGFPPTATTNDVSPNVAAEQDERLRQLTDRNEQLEKEIALLKSQFVLRGQDASFQNAGQTDNADKQRQLVGAEAVFEDDRKNLEVIRSTPSHQASNAGTVPVFTCEAGLVPVPRMIDQSRPGFRAPYSGHLEDIQEKLQKEVVHRLRRRILKLSDPFSLCQIACFTALDREGFDAITTNSRRFGKVLDVLLARDEWWADFLDVIEDEYHEEDLARQLREMLTHLTERYRCDGELVFTFCPDTGSTSEMMTPWGASGGHVQKADTIYNIYTTSPGTCPTQDIQACIDSSQERKAVAGPVSTTLKLKFEKKGEGHEDGALMQRSHMTALLIRVFCRRQAHNSEVEEQQTLEARCHANLTAIKKGCFELIFDITDDDPTTLKTLIAALNDGSFPEAYRRALQEALLEGGCTDDYTFKEARVQMTPHAVPTGSQYQREAGPSRQQTNPQTSNPKAKKSNIRRKRAAVRNSRFWGKHTNPNFKKERNCWRSLFKQRMLKKHGLDSYLDEDVKVAEGICKNTSPVSTGDDGPGQFDQADQCTHRSTSQCLEEFISSLSPDQFSLLLQLHYRWSRKAEHQAAIEEMQKQLRQANRKTEHQAAIEEMQKQLRQAKSDADTTKGQFKEKKKQCEELNRREKELLRLSEMPDLEASMVERITELRSRAEQRKALRRLSGYCLIILFVLYVVAFALEFHRVHVIAVQYDVLHVGLPSECSDKIATWFDFMRSTVRQWASFNDDPCVKYFGASLTSMSPKVAMEIVTEIVVQSFEGVGNASVALFSKLTTIWLFAMFLLLVIVGIMSLFLCLVSWLRLSVHIPFVVSIEAKDKGMYCGRCEQIFEASELKDRKRKGWLSSLFRIKSSKKLE